MTRLTPGLTALTLKLVYLGLTDRLDAPRKTDPPRSTFESHLRWSGGAGFGDGSSGGGARDCKTDRGPHRKGKGGEGAVLRVLGYAVEECAERHHPVHLVRGN